MKRWLLLVGALACLLFPRLALAQACPAGWSCGSLPAYVGGLDVASTPLVTDYYFLDQGGVGRRLPGTSLLYYGNNLSDVANAATARNNLLGGAASGTPTRYLGLSAGNAVVTGGGGTGGTVLSAKDYGAICDGGNHPLSGVYGSLAAAQVKYPFVTSLSQQIDYAALKLMSNTALGADGSEHGSPGTGNQPMFVPSGTCNIGADTWLIRNAVGLSLSGVGEATTVIQSSGTVFATDGLWYSRIQDIGFATTSSGATVAVDIDGNVPDHPYSTRSVQGNEFEQISVSGGGSTYAMAMCRQGGGGAQCSENVFVNFHGSGASTAVYYQNGYNALDNVMVGGDMQNFTANGAQIDFGSISFYRVSFESGSGYGQVSAGACDIKANAGGAFTPIIVDGVRSEDMCIYLGAVSQPLSMRGVNQNLGSYTWSAATPFTLNNITVQVGADSLHHAYYVSTAGTSGGTEPTWPNSGTVNDGSVVWTEVNYNAIYGFGCVEYGSLRLNESARMQVYGCTLTGGGFIDTYTYPSESAPLHFTQFFSDGNGNLQGETCLFNNICMYTNPQSSPATLQSGLTFPVTSTGIFGDNLLLSSGTGGTVTIGSNNSGAANPGGSVVLDSPTTVGGNLTTNITGSTQCVHAGTDGVLSGAGPDCGVISPYSPLRVESNWHDTLLTSDCGREVLYTYGGGGITTTIPSAIVPAVGSSCFIRIRTATANKVSLTGHAAPTATLVSADSYTGTQAVAGSGISLDLTTVGSTATAFLDGHGSVAASPPSPSALVWDATHCIASLTGCGTVTVNRTSAGTNYLPAFGSEGESTGLFYIEVSVNDYTTGDTTFGLGNTSSSISETQYLGKGEDTLGVWFVDSGHVSIVVNDIAQATLPITSASNDRWGLAIDVTDSKLCVSDITAHSGWWGSSSSVQCDPVAKTNMFNLAGSGFTIMAHPIAVGTALFTNGDTATIYPSVTDWVGDDPNGYSQFP